MTNRAFTTSISTLLAVAAAASCFVAGPAGAATTKKIYACIAGDFKTLNLTTRRARCPRGQQKISWNVVGESGKPGAKGSPGSHGVSGTQGAQGAQGAQGPQGPAGSGGGATGAAGATGATGAIGAQGSLGPTGAAGATGPTGAQGDKGDQGDQGATGATGATGPPGADGNGGAYLSTSGGPVTLTTDGTLSETAWMPLTGSASAPDGSWNNVMQYSPGDVQVTRVRATFTPSFIMFTPFGLTLNIQVHTANAPISASPPTPTTATCSIPSPGIMFPGDVFSCDVAVSAPLLSSEGVAIGISLSTPFAETLTGNVSTAVDVN